MSKREHPLATLPENWQEVLLKHYEQGASDTEVRAELRMTANKFYELMDDSPDFFDTVILGRMMAKAWWLKQGRHNLDNKQYNAYLWYKNMQNRFGWSEKQTSNVVDSPVQGEADSYDDSEADERLQELLNEHEVVH